MFRHLTKTLLLAAVFASLAAVADDGTVASTTIASQKGRPVADVLEELREQGNEIVYSSRLVPPDLLVTVELSSPLSFSSLFQILAPLGLTLKHDNGLFIVVRLPAEPAMPATGPQIRPPAGNRDVETITVSASRYEISRDPGPSRFVLDQRTIQNMPDFGEDPIRIAQRLPGAAASGVSARAHFRGGEHGEVGIILNGQHLFDPFHVRDYQNIFSAIDARAIEGVEIFTGGFPVRFGDRMSGLVLMESMDAEKPRHTEIGVSVFNTSVLTAGSRGNARWLFSARRGNLDLVIDKKFGRPSYYDIFSQFELDIGSNTTISANALYADDIVTVVLETDPAEREEARSTTRNAQVWVQVDTQWSNTLSSRTAVSSTTYENRRDGFTADPDKVVATVRDDRDVDQVGFRQDWAFRASDKHFMQWGFSITNSDASYDYAADAEYFGLPALYEGQVSSFTRALTAAPSGGSYALYVADRWKVTPKTAVEWGLRWDDQTYTDISSDSQLSPRFSVLHRWSEATELRFSWGRYHQSQGVHELQIEDGISNFWPAQRADHLIAGLTHQVNERLELRIEAFHKNMQGVRPRFENLFDPLALIPELQADRVRLDPNSARSAGLEISLNGSNGEWSWWTSYTLSEAFDRIDSRTESRSWDQRHALQGGVSWSNERWNVALAAGAHTGWPTTGLTLNQTGIDIDGEPIYVAIPGERNALRHSNFGSVDFRASRAFNVRRGKLTAFVEVSNLVNRHNVCCIDWDVADGPGGTTELESSKDFWLPLLPAVGVLWEF